MKPPRKYQYDLKLTAKEAFALDSVLDVAIDALRHAETKEYKRDAIQARRIRERLNHLLNTLPK